MSYLPVNWAAFENRGSGDRATRIPPKVLVKGSEKAVIRLMPEFRAGYVDTVRLMGASVIEQQRFDRDIGLNGHMTVISNHNQDIIYLEAYDDEVVEPQKFQIEGFLVTLDDGTQRLYEFDFDGNAFKYSSEIDLKAGNRRVYIDDEVYISWDGTGGGDIKPESDPEPSANENASPFAALSKKLYAQGEEYDFVDSGYIFGVGSDGTDLVVATITNYVLTLHSGTVVLDQDDDKKIIDITYDRVIGSCTVKWPTVVNFNSTLTQALCGENLIQFDTSLEVAVPPAVSTLNIPSGMKVVWSGFDASDVINYTVKETTKKIDGGLYCPHGPDEDVEGITTNPNPRVSKGDVDESYAYYDLVGEATPSNPSYTGARHDYMVCTVEKEAFLTMDGIFPVLRYKWNRTTSMQDIEKNNVYYWYSDYKTAEYVRCQWLRKLSRTIMFWGSGLESELDNIDVERVSTSNFNGQKMITAYGDGEWYYTCANGQGDFICKKKPNGTKTSAMLISKSGALITVDDVVHVGII